MRLKRNGGGKGFTIEVDGGTDDWQYLIDNILAGRELHDSLRDLGAKLIASGMSAGAAVNQLRAFMNVSTAPRDDRWQERYDDIVRLVESAEDLRNEKARSAAADAPSRSLDEVQTVFRKWLGADYDVHILNAALAAAASEQLSGDPLWLLVISGSGNAKTETVQALAGAGTQVTSTIASEGALLSATPRREKSKHATGGLLRKIGNRGILVIKDVTSILSADRNVRAGVLAALREIHDGCWERNVGTDGGRTLTWTGRLVVIGAVTTAWDAAHGVIAAMGDRFIIIRSKSTVARANSAIKAISNTGECYARRIGASGGRIDLQRQQGWVSPQQRGDRPAGQGRRHRDLCPHRRRARLQRRSDRRACARDAHTLRQAACATCSRRGGNRYVSRRRHASRNPLRPRQHPAAAARNSARYCRQPRLPPARSASTYRPPQAHGPPRA
jgi:hypothetical protein